MKTEIEQSGWEEKEPLPARVDRLVGSESETEGTSARENLALWIGILGSAIIWAIQLQTSYAMVPWACSSGHRWMLPVVSAGFLIAAAIPGVMAWRLWRTMSRARSERETRYAGRRRFMAMLGMMDSAIFFLLILAQGLPVFFIHPCLE